MTDLPLSPIVQNVLQDSQELAGKLHRNGVDIDLFFHSFINNLSLSCEFILSNLDLIEILQYESINVIEKKKPNKTTSQKFNKDVGLLFQGIEESNSTFFFSDYVSPELVLLNLLNKDIQPKAIKKVLDDFEGLEDSLVQEITFFCLDLNDTDETENLEEDDNIEGSENWIDMFENNPIICEFAENLNIKAAENKIDQIVDFDNKISEIATILCRKKKPNAILVGPAGTGKTSLIEGLARKIVDGDVPELIANKVIYSLSLSSMVAGTQYRGQFEERLEGFINEVKKYDNIIIFIDEIHTLVGAGNTNENSLEASNILKPELARGTISCIGATTVSEYNNTIKKDSALDRRFERVVIKEPSRFQMEQILPSISSYYEEFHKVKYTEEFINNVTSFCERYLPNKHYPDKAIDVIDHCGAQAKVSYWKIDPSIRDLQNEIIQKIANNQNHETLLELMNSKIEDWSEKMNLETPEVTIEHLKDFFKKKQNYLSDTESIDNFCQDLLKNIAGNKKQILKLKNEIILSNFRFNKQNHSPNIYCIAGDEFSGKTFFCSKIQEILEKNGANVITYNGIHFSGEHDDNKIISNLNNNTSLCEQICLHPNSIIIIDDFHKINFFTKNLFAQIFKDGRLTMPNGDIADFSNCKIFLTSDLVEQKQMGFIEDGGNKQLSIFKELCKFFDSTLFLEKLNERDFRRVLWQKLKDLQEKLKMQDIKLQFNFNYIKNFASGIKNLQQLNNKIKENVTSQIYSKISDSQKIIHFEG